MITLKPNGGLCNRLRMIDSGIVLSRDIRQPLKVLWMLTPELNCSYYDLFEDSEQFQVVDTEPSRWDKMPLPGKLKFILDYSLVRIRHQQVVFQSRLDRLKDQQYDFTQFKQSKSVYITGCSRFFRHERCYQPFVPIKPIRDVIDAYTQQYTSHTIGIHIRRTDHQLAISSSPDQGFIDAMNAEVEKRSDTRFFLASDSPEVNDCFTTLFADRIIWHQKEYSRNSSKGVQDALVDLMCLSQTQKVIGSYGSSFSVTAAQIYDKPFQSIQG